MRFTRAFYIPAGALKIADKQSDAVAYLQERPTGRFTVMAFCGKRQKPDLHFTYAKRRDAEEDIARYFERRRATLARQAEQRAADQARRHAPIRLEVGTVLVGSWGYDQTNVDAWQVTRIVGKCTVEIRKVHTMSAGETGPMSGRVIPCPDDFADDKPVIKRVVEGNRISFDCFTLRPWDGKSLYCSSYH